jgi:DNA modification methylase
MKKYSDFIKTKIKYKSFFGFEYKNKSEILFDFQSDIVNWACKIGRAAIFADCGLGKTLMQLEWAKNIDGNVLFVAPLAVTSQTIKEAKDKLNLNLEYHRQQPEKVKYVITNYEMLENFDADYFDGIVLDESSILKSFAGKFRNSIIEKFKNTKYKLCCTATPSPNDFMELGNHSEFLGYNDYIDMLSMYFIHDAGETQKWKIKGHAEDEFWRWVCSWAVMLQKPSDLGYVDGNFILPEIEYHKISIETNKKIDGFLFQMEAQTLQERNRARSETTEDRCNIAADIVNKKDGPFLVWCNLNKESELLNRLIKDSKEIKGSDDLEYKKNTMQDFSNKKLKRLITKPSIAGFGMNWQHCNNMAFVGLSDSYEQFYQAVRRCWRFGQKKKVNCYIITADIEGEVVKNIERKNADAEKMAKEMIKHMSIYNKENIHKTVNKEDLKQEEIIKKTNNFEIVNGDCVEALMKVEDNYFDYSIFSPPFASLYSYSDSEKDMGNCKNNITFYRQFKYLVKELYRTIKPGRLVSFHCMNLPTSKFKHGYIGIEDFRGILIRLFQRAGFIYVSEVCIWKDPVVAMQRTKAKGLLHKQVVKDSADSRQGIPDYLVTMKKPGENINPIAGEFDHFCGDENTFKSNGRLSIDIWQKYASPIWMDINQSNTLQRTSAREEKDEKHICPLQLDVIHRALQLWTNKGDLVLSPFAGIGSEGYESIKLERKFYGIELKKSYFNQMFLNLQNAEKEIYTNSLFKDGVL